MNHGCIWGNVSTYIFTGEVIMTFKKTLLDLPSTYSYTSVIFSVITGFYGYYI